MSETAPRNACGLHANGAGKYSLDSEALDSVIVAVVGHLGSIHQDLLERYPLAGYVKLMDDVPPLSGYKEVPRRIQTFGAGIENLAGKDTLDQYHRAVLLTLVRDMPAKIAAGNYSDEIRSLFVDEMFRIVSEVQANDVGFYLFDNDLFFKDLAIATLRMYPAGVLKVEAHAGIPRSFLLSGGTRQFLRGARMIRALGGFHPYYEIHLDIRYRADFTPGGWDSALLHTAGMLKRHEEVKGMIGASWFFDPQIRTMSPRLAYLRQRIEENGGEFFYMKSDDRTAQLATSASASRRKLYESGEYAPASYMTIWPRTRMLAWAAREECTSK